VEVKDQEDCVDTCEAVLIVEPCGFCTFTIGGWGTKCPDPQVDWPMSTQPGCIRDHFFDQVFPNGVWIGNPAIVPTTTMKVAPETDPSGEIKRTESVYPVSVAKAGILSPWYGALWTTSGAVRDYLPDGSKSGVLNMNYYNSDTTSAGVLGSQILALRLNVAYSCSGVFTYLGLLGPDSCYGNQSIPGSCGYGKFNGILINDFLAIADSVVGGELDSAGLKNNYNAKLSDVNKTATCLNEQFSDGIDNTNCMVIPTVPVAPFSAAAKVSASGALPTEFSLSQSYPNPFNPTCVIEYALPTDSKVNLTIYNILGRKVRVLVDDYETAGYRSVEWDGRDSQGQILASGIYFYRIVAENFVQTKKMVLIK
jgi:hypothetical protein